MSSLSTIEVGRWIQEGFFINEMVQPNTRPFTIRAGRTRRVPRTNYIFTAEEGILKVFTAAFDDPRCGIRIECPPNFDTDNRFTVQNFMAATSKSDSIYSLTPPYTPPGTYLIRRTTDMLWQHTLRLSVFNNDTEDHLCLAYGYQVALKKVKDIHEEE